MSFPTLSKNWPTPDEFNTPSSPDCKVLTAYTPNTSAATVKVLRMFWWQGTNRLATVSPRIVWDLLLLNIFNTRFSAKLAQFTTYHFPSDSLSNSDYLPGSGKLRYGLELHKPSVHMHLNCSYCDAKKTTDWLSTCAVRLCNLTPNFHHVLNLYFYVTHNCLEIPANKSCRSAYIGIRCFDTQFKNGLHEWKLTQESSTVYR